MSQTNGNPAPPDEVAVTAPPDLRVRMEAQSAREIRLAKLAPGQVNRVKTAPPHNGRNVSVEAAPKPGPDEAARAARIAAREQWLDRKEQDLLATRRELDQVRVDLDNASANLNSARAKHEAQRRALAQALRRRSGRLKKLRDDFRARQTANRAAIVQQLAELARERDQLISAEAQLQHANDSLQRELLQLDVRRDALQEQERAIEEERAGVLAQASDLAQLGQELERTQAALAQERAALAKEQEQLAARLSSLEQEFTQRHDALEAQVAKRRKALEAETDQRQKSLDARARELTSLEESHRREGARLDAWRTDLEQQGEAAARRAAELDQNHRDLQAERTILANGQSALAEREQTLQERQNDLDAALEELSRQRDELFHTQKEVEGREAEARQSSAALEVERLEAKGLREQLQQQLAEAVQERQEFEQTSREARVALASEARRLTRLGPTTGTGPVRWGLRSLLVSTAAAAVCAGLAWTLTQPQRESHATLQLANSSRPFPVAAAEHVAALSDPKLADQWLPDAGEAKQWSDLLNREQVRINAVSRETAIRIAVPGDAVAAGELLKKVAENYTRRQKQTESLRDLPAAFTLLDQMGNRIRAEQNRIESESAQLDAELAADDSPQLAKIASDRLEELLRDQQSTISSLADARDRLASAVAITHPRGEVAQETLEAALAQDEIYQQDARELESVVQGYREELLQALDAAPDAIARYRTVLQPLRETLRQQVALRPPAQIARALEASMGEIDACAEITDRFFRAWTDAAATIPTEASVATAASLIDACDEASEAARRLTRAGENLSQSLNKRWEALEALGDGGTREVVTLNTVRSAINSFSTSIVALRRDLSSIEREENFELDALDRQVRSLQQRRSERPQAVLARLQAEADQEAAENHARQIDSLRNRVEDLSARREALSVSVAEQIEVARAAQERSLNRHSRELEQTARRAQVGRLSTELQQVETDLQVVRADAAQAQADQLILREIRTEETPDPHRPVRIVSAGAGGFSLAWLACAALMAQMPRRANPRQAILARLAREAEPAQDGNPYESADTAGRD